MWILSSKILRSVNEKYQEGSPEDEALRVAATALFYLREIQKLEDYREFFRSFHTPAIDYVVRLLKRLRRGKRRMCGLPVARSRMEIGSALLARASGSSQRGRAKGGGFFEVLCQKNWRKNLLLMRRTRHASGVWQDGSPHEQADQRH